MSGSGIYRTNFSGLGEEGETIAVKKMQPPETNSNSMFSRIPLALSKFPRLIPISQPLGEYSAIFVCKYCPPPHIRKPTMGQTGREFCIS
jgi:hypothetical protein